MVTKKQMDTPPGVVSIVVATIMTAVAAMAMAAMMVPPMTAVPAVVAVPLIVAMATVPMAFAVTVSTVTMRCRIACRAHTKREDESQRECRDLHNVPSYRVPDL